MENVTAAILIHDGKILIAKRGPRDNLANKWEFPGGKVEDGETMKVLYQGHAEKVLLYGIEYFNLFPNTTPRYFFGFGNI